MKNRDLEKAVADILLRVWDPIGVSDEPKAQDEYNAYAPAIARMIDSADSPRLIAEHLLTIERERMDLPGNQERALAAAQYLARMGERP